MTPKRVDIDRILGDREKIEAALGAAVRDALTRHKRAGDPVAVWHDGKVIWLTPEEIPVAVENAA